MHVGSLVQRPVVVLVLVLLVSHGVLAAILGIDLGQANTKAVVVAPGAAFEIVLSRDSKRKDVSGVAFKGDERMYGSSASSLAARFPSTAFLNFKSIIGKSIDSPEAHAYLESHPGISIAPSGNRSTISFKTPDSVFAVEEILAMQFTHIKTLADEMLPSGSPPIRDVSITCPVYFDNVQRGALIDAAELSGLHVVSLVSDGVAVGINYASSRSFPTKQYAYVLDIGASSTSATLLSFQEVPGKYSKTALNITVEGVGYDETLGGELLDSRMYEILKSRFVEKHGSAIESSPRALVRLRREAERAKTILSANTEVRASIESLFDDIDFRTVVTRAEFEESIADVLPRLKKPFEDSLQAAGLTIDDVPSVILAGGSTRVPAFQQRIVSDVLGGDASKLSKTVNADESAVLGTTFRGVSISGQFKTKEINVIERYPYNFDLVIRDPKSSDVLHTQTLVTQGTILPISMSRYRVPLDIPAGVENATFEFQENGHPLFSYNVHSIESTRRQIEEVNDCVDLSAGITVALSPSRVVSLSELTYVCNRSSEKVESMFEDESLKQKVFNFFNKQSSEEEAGEEQSETATKTASEDGNKATASTPVIKPTIRAETIKRPIKHGVSYLAPRNMGRATKGASQARLRAFDNLDRERQMRDAARNDLEAYSYRIRERIESGYERFLEHSSDEERSQYLSKASHALDWLYEESESMILDKLKEKLIELREFEDIVFKREMEKLKELEKDLLPPEEEAEADTAFEESESVPEQKIKVEEPVEAEESKSTTEVPNTEGTTFQESPEPVTHDEL
ncbi:heat shock protein 70 family [Dipodascopsis uninucleata]